MPDDATQHATDGPTLNDCRMLIARIDGTMAALVRERELLACRASKLTEAQPRDEQRHAE